MAVLPGSVPITFIGNLDLSKPLNSSLVIDGDDELRELKNSIKSTFPNVTSILSNLKPDDLNQLKGKISIYPPPDNYIDISQEISLPFLPRIPLSTNPDWDYLNINNLGEFERYFPAGPLGSILISPFTEAEMTLISSGCYVLCKGQLLEPTSELFLQLNPTPGYLLPDLTTKGRIIRNVDSTHPNLSVIDSTAFVDVPIIASEYKHNHGPDWHVHSDFYYYSEPPKPAKTVTPGQSFSWAGSYKKANDLVTSNGYTTLGPIIYDIFTSSESPWILPFDPPHIHDITWNSDPDTRAQEHTFNFFIRIN